MIACAIVWMPLAAPPIDLLRPVAGVPLLLRTLLTAQRAGVNDILLLASGGWRELPQRIMQDRRLSAHLRWVADQPWPRLAQAMPDLESAWEETDLWVVPADAVIDVSLFREMAERPASRPVEVIGEWPKRSMEEEAALWRVSGRWLRPLLQTSTHLPLSTVLQDLQRRSDVEYIPNNGRLCTRTLTDQDRQRVEQELFAGLQSPSDGWVDRYVNRRVSARWTRWLLWTPLTPNHVTLMSFAIGLLAAISFAQAGWLSGVLGALLLQCSAIIDCCDGEVARLKFLESPGGYYLDITCDNVVHVAVFAAIAWSSYQASGDHGILVLGVLAVLGTIISFLIVLTTRHGRTQTHSSVIDRLIDALTTRDFSLLLLVVALLGKLEWILWALAIGVNLFWPTVLGLSWKGRRRAYG